MARVLRRAGLLAVLLVALAAGALAQPNDQPGGPNPARPFDEAIAKNIYLTKNWYVGSYHYVQCWGNSLIIPEDTKQAANAVGHYYNKTRAGQPVTLRASRPRFHSSAHFVCPNSPLKTGGRWPADLAKKDPLAVAVLTQKLNKVLAVDKEKFTMRVGAGMRYTELLKEATKAGMSVKIGSPTAYAGLTLGGVLATTGHGSGDRAVSGIWDTLLEVTWVDGTGTVRTSKPGDAEFRGIVGGVGVFALVTELTMQMTPPTLTQLITVRKSDKDMMKTIEELLKITPHILIFWRPDISEFVAYLVKEAPAGSKAASNVSMTLLPNIASRDPGADAFKLLSSNLDDDSEAFEFLCPLQTDASLSSSWGSVNGVGVKNVTGPTNDLMASECDEHCNWNDNKVFFGTAQDVEFTAEYDQLADWIEDVKKVFYMDLFEMNSKKYRCMGPGYLWIRFGSGFDGYTATMSGFKRPVFLQSTWLRSRAAPNYPIRYQYVIDLLEMVTLCKYDARPHWGKNFDRTFTYPKCGVRAKYPKFNDLLALQSKYDPAKMFEPRLFSRVVKNEGFKLSPRCTLWQDCYCEEDINCPKDFKCTRSLAFPEFKVCKHDTKDLKGTLLTQIFATMAGNNQGDDGAAAAPAPPPARPPGPAPTTGRPAPTRQPFGR